MLGDLPPVAVALARVAVEVGAVGKTARNLQQGFNFRGIDDVLNAVGPVLHRHQVNVRPVVESADYAEVEVGQRKTPMRQCTLRVTYLFAGPAGDCLSATVMAEALDAGDKATSKAMSVALRTALIQVLALPTGEPDPDAASYQRAPTEPTSAPPASRMTPGRADTPIMAVINLARAAGVQGDALVSDVAARHGGRTLADLSTAELRAEWGHWNGKQANQSAVDQPHDSHPRGMEMSPAA